MFLESLVEDQVLIFNVLSSASFAKSHSGCRGNVTRLHQVFSVTELISLWNGSSVQTGSNWPAMTLRRAHFSGIWSFITGHFKVLPRDCCADVYALGSVPTSSPGSQNPSVARLRETAVDLSLTPSCSSALVEYALLTYFLPHREKAVPGILHQRQPGP